MSEGVVNRIVILLGVVVVQILLLGGVVQLHVFPSLIRLLGTQMGRPVALSDLPRAHFTR